MTRSGRGRLGGVGLARSLDCAAGAPAAANISSITRIRFCLGLVVRFGLNCSRKIILSVVWRKTPSTCQRACTDDQKINIQVRGTQRRRPRWLLAKGLGVSLATLGIRIGRLVILLGKPRERNRSIGET